MPCYCECEILKKNTYFLFFMISVLIQFVILLILIIYYFATRNKFIWFNSKILTIEGILKYNYANYKIYQSFAGYHYYISLNYSYYDLLKNSTKDKCAENLKQCGILDTYGNKLCLNKDIPCPINDLVLDKKSKSLEYKEKGYEEINYKILRKYDGYSFYYKNTSINNRIISSLLYLDFEPRLIDIHNFIFDTEAYEMKYNYKASIFFNQSNEKNKDKEENFFNLTKNFESAEEEIEIWYEVPEYRATILETPNLKEYIISKLNDNNNNYDKNYTKIFDKMYSKNYVGFESAEEMDKFKNINFSVYKKLFPDNCKIILMIIIEASLFIFTIIYLRKLYEDKEEGDNNDCKINENYIVICGISIYFLPFIYFFIEFCRSANELFKNDDFYKLKNIKCDQIIKDFIEEFIQKYDHKRLWVLVIIFSLSISLPFYFFSIFYYLKKNAFQDERVTSEDVEIFNNRVNNGNLINDKYNKKEDEKDKKNEDNKTKIIHYHNNKENAKNYNHSEFEQNKDEEKSKKNINDNNKIENENIDPGSNTARKINLNSKNNNNIVKKKKDINCLII